MPVLHLEKVPEELYHRIEQLADAANVPLADEAVRLLHEAVGRKLPQNGSRPAGRSQREILDDIIRHRFSPKPGLPTVVDILREDRQR